MTKILSIKSHQLPSNLEKEAEKESLLGKLLGYFKSLDKFTQAFIIFTSLFLIATPVITGQYFDTRQRAQTISIDSSLVSTPNGIVLNVSPSTEMVGSGIVGNYFNNINFTKLKLTRVDQAIDFDWGNGSPDPLIENGSFSIVWDAHIVSPKTDKYTFYVYSDDGARLWVNNQMVIDAWSGHKGEEISGSIYLEEGKTYPLKLEYYQNTEKAAIKLYWSSLVLSKQLLSKDYLK
ncbi:MAG: PA14 domain-containing protein [Candidatus Levybacteria bacterium]|nr:PA14 domain-containing protein [Candidatus Levybacteria bacterium]